MGKFLGFSGICEILWAFVGLFWIFEPADFFDLDFGFTGSPPNFWDFKIFLGGIFWDFWDFLRFLGSPWDFSDFRDFRDFLWISQKSVSDFLK